MRNTLGDLNNHLFMQIERLGEEDITIEELEKEKERTKAMNSIAKTIIENASLVLDAKKIMADTMDADAKLPRMLEG